MTLFAILVSLGVQRFANVGGWFKESWFEFYLSRLSSWIPKFNKHLAMILILTPVLLSLLLFQIITVLCFGKYFNAIFSIALLLLCVDARSFKKGLEGYFFAVEKKEIDSAVTAAANFVDGDGAKDLSSLSRSVTKAIILKSFERVFVGLFWFIMLGVYGLAIYFIFVLTRNNATKINAGYVELSKLAEKAQSIMGWLPSRLLGFTFSLVGYFNKGFAYCVTNALSGLDSVRKFVLESGMASLDIGESTQADQTENIDAIDLIDRSLIIWLTVIALILIGMLFSSLT